MAPALKRARAADTASDSSADAVVASTVSEASHSPSSSSSSNISSMEELNSSRLTSFLDAQRRAAELREQHQHEPLRFPICTAGILARRRRANAGLMFADLIEIGALLIRNRGNPLFPLRWLELKVCAGESVPDDFAADSEVNSLVPDRIDAGSPVALKTIGDSSVSNHGDAAAVAAGELSLTAVGPVCASPADVQCVRRAAALGSVVIVAGQVSVEDGGHLLLHVARWRTLMAPAEVVLFPGMDRALLNRSLHSREARVLLGVGTAEMAGPMSAAEAGHLPKGQLMPQPQPTRSLCHAWAQLQRLGDALPAACGVQCLRDDVHARGTSSGTPAPGSAVSAVVLHGTDQGTVPDAATPAGDRQVVGSCGRRHYWESVREQSRWEERRRRAEEARRAAIDESDPHTDKESKLHRAVVFVDWLVETFGIERLSSGTGVLDVAGGRGAVSFELFNKRGIPATLIEPRDRKLDRAQRTWLKALPEGQRVLCKHIQTFFTPDILQLPPDDDMLALVRNCSLVIGLHSDEATEPIVDVAIAAGIPFAVVPCCTFAHLHPERRTPDGHAIRTTSELADYLSHKTRQASLTCEEAYLNFKGRNKVIFSRGRADE